MTCLVVAGSKKMGGHRLWTMELESRQDTCWFHALGIHQAMEWIGSVQARLERSPAYSSIEKGIGLQIPCVSH